MNGDSSACCVLLGLVGLAVVATAAQARARITIRPLRADEEFDHQLCKRLGGMSGLPQAHAAWPRLPEALLAGNGSETLVAEVRGLIVGRAVLEAPYQPYSELVSLVVRPDYRRRGVATALVEEAIRRARELGRKYMVLQEGHDLPAHSVYERAGFVGGTVGEMRRLMHLLDVPLVSTFLREHPAAVFASEPAADRGERWWRLSWREGDETVALYVRGGSCQSDSDGFQPVVQGCEVTCGGRRLAAAVEMPPAIARTVPGRYPSPRDGTAEMRVAIENRGEAPFEGALRAVLLPDTEVIGEHAGAAARLHLEAGEAISVPLGFRVRPQFRTDLQRFVSYPSVPFTAELCWDQSSVLLSAAVKVT